MPKTETTLICDHCKKEILISNGADLKYWVVKVIKDGSLFCSPKCSRRYEAAKNEKEI